MLATTPVLNQTSRPMRTITIQAAALIDAPAERVYGILADYKDGHPGILPKSFFESLTVEKGGYGAGTVFSVTSKFLGIRRTARMVVSEPQPGCLLAETDDEHGLYTTFRVSPEHHDRHAHVTIQTDFRRSPGLRGVIEAWLYPKMFRSVYVAELEQLARLSNVRGQKSDVTRQEAIAGAGSRGRVIAS